MYFKGFLGRETSFPYILLRKRITAGCVVITDRCVMLTVDITACVIALVVDYTPILHAFCISLEWL